MESVIQSYNRYPNARGAIEVVLKLVIFILLLGAIYKQVFYKQDIHSLVATMRDLSSGLYFIPVILLMLCNWGLEAAKWRYLIRKVEQISVTKAVLAIFSGTTFTLFTPNRIGEYAGRFLLINNPLRPDLLAATILGSISQIIVTLVAGMAGLMLVSQALFTGFDPELIGYITVISIILVLSCYFCFNPIYRWLGKSMTALFGDKFPNSLRYRQSELLCALTLSALRYGVYAAQFWLLLQFYGAGVQASYALAAITVVFLLQTLIPSIAILDLGIRGNIALLVFSAFSANQPAILAAALSLWLINLVIPAVFGYCIIVYSRLFKTGNLHLQES